MLSYCFYHFLLVDQKIFFHQSKHYSLLILQVKESIYCDFFGMHSLSSNDETKSLFSSWKLGPIKYSKYLLHAYVDTLYWYLFQIIMCLNPDFNCCNNFALFWVDKFTNRTLSFVLVIANLATWSAATFDDTTNFLDQVSLR